MQRFHIPLILITITAGATWYYIFHTISPLNPDGTIHVPILVVFLLTLGTATTGIGTLSGYHLRRLFGSQIHPSHTYIQSLRQAILASVGLILLFVLSVTELLNPITVLLSAVTLITLEWYSK